MNIIGRTKGLCKWTPWIYKPLLTMKLAVLFICIITFQAAAESYAQRITLKEQNIKLSEAMEKIYLQTGYEVLFSGKQQANTKITIDIQNATIEMAMKTLLEGLPLTWTVKNRIIVIRSAPDRRPPIPVARSLTNQDNNAQGRVVDSEGNPLRGVTVRLRNLQQATMTDENGDYRITLPEGGGILVFTILGYEEKTRSVGEPGTYNIVLAASTSDLSEVIVTGYGNTARRAFTGSASSISNEQMKDLQATSITDVIQGNASGVLAVAGTGQPGEEPAIRIRGIGSFNASNEPLILLDGAPYTGSINSINPSDIESLTILKDASSTSIYGSRAANGIIQIVTKRGKGRNKFDFSSVVGASSRAVSEYNTVNEQQYYELTWEALRNDAVEDPALLTTNSVGSPEEYATKLVTARLMYNPFDVQNPVGMDGKLVEGASLRWSENWMDQMLRIGLRQDFNGSISGSSEDDKISYFVGGGYLQDQGIVADSEFKRYSGRLNLTSKITNWLELGVNSSLAKSDQNYPYQGTEYASNVLAFARTIAPIYPVHLVDFTTGEFILDDQGNKIYDFGNNTAVLGELRPTNEVRLFRTGQNVAATTTLNPNTFSRLTGNGLAYLQAKLFDGFTFRSQYSVDYNTTQNDLFWNPFYGDGTTTNGYAYRGITNLTSQNFANSFTYDNTFGIHHINVVGGMEAFRQVTEFTSAARSGFTFADPKQVSYGTLAEASGNQNEFRLESYFSRANYNIANRYHLSLSLRTDGSTRFDENHRWGVFYAVGTAWNMHEENFLKDISWLSLLKPKVSYGSSGNQGLQGYFPYLGTYDAGANIGSASGSVISTVSNEYLSWEKQNQLDVGIEFGFLRDRFTGSFTYFNRKSDGLLFERPLPNSSGVNAISDNAGGVKNYGYEFDLTSNNILRQHFSWKTMFNITRLRNVITEAAPGTTQVVGGSWYDFYIREYAGVDLTDGSPMWYRDGESGEKVTTKVYDDATYYYIGNRLQDYTGGITNFLRYKNFDFSMLASFGIGGEYYDGNYGGLMGGIKATGTNASTDILNRWQSPENPGDGMTPKLLTSSDNVAATSTRFLYDHTFMRIRNITLGYTLSQTLLDRINIRNARLFFSAQNPFTFFGGPKGADPETGINASATNNDTSVNKFLSFGLNIGL